MGEERVKLTIDEAVKMLPTGGTVHVFCDGGAGVLIGADWDMSDIIDAFKKSPPELSGPQATAMGHGIAFRTEHGGGSQRRLSSHE